MVRGRDAVDAYRLRSAYADSLRATAFLSVAFGFGSGGSFSGSINFRTAATIASVLLVPLVYSYVQRVQSALGVDFAICAGDTDRLWTEFEHTEQVSKGITDHRQRLPI